MARKRPYGTGYIRKVGDSWRIRWRETVIVDGAKRSRLRYENLGRISKREASKVLAERLAAAEVRAEADEKRTFQELAAEWSRSVLPMYKHSTRKNHHHIVGKHLLPAFGDVPLAEMRKPLLQSYVAQLERRGYAPKTIDHIHDVLSAVLRTGVQWGYLPENPAGGLALPKLRTVRPKWALTESQAALLVQALPPLPRTMIAMALATGLRRGELFALRWSSIDEDSGVIRVTEAVYEGSFGSPKTAAGTRNVPLPPQALELLAEWKADVYGGDPSSLVFATRSGKPISPNNILRRYVFPACEELGLPRATWLTFRRTYSSWAHDKGVPQKVVAELLGHANVYTTMNVYTQTVEGAQRAAADRIGEKLFKIVQTGN